MKTLAVKNLAITVAETVKNQVRTPKLPPLTLSMYCTHKNCQHTPIVFGLKKSGFDWQNQGSPEYLESCSGFLK